MAPESRDTATTPGLPFIDEYEERVDAPAEATWSALVAFFRAGARRTSFLAGLLNCDPRRGSERFDGRPGDQVPGFRVAASEPGRLLALRGRHRFANYALTFRIEGGSLRARTDAAFPGVRGRLYRSVVIGSGGHRFLTRRILRRIARAAEHR
jgi:hypothetical protein